MKCKYVIYTVFASLMLNSSVHAQTENYDILNGRKDNLVLLSREHFTSASLTYPGLQGIYSEPDTVKAGNHLILGTRGNYFSENAGGSNINRNAFINSPLAGLYGTFMRDLGHLTSGLYLGSLQLVSTSGEFPSDRYGFRAAMFTENRDGFFGGGSAMLYLDRMTHDQVLGYHNAEEYNNRTIVPAYSDKRFQRSFLGDLSLITTFFPFGRDRNSDKMIILAFNGSRSKDSSSDSTANVYVNESGPDSARQYDLIRIPEISGIFHNTERAVASLTFLSLNFRYSLFKLSVSGSYSRLYTDTLLDSTGVIRKDTTYEKANRKYRVSGLRYDTSGLVFGLTERFVSTLKPVVLILGFDGTISIKVFRNKNQPSISGNLRYYYHNSSFREYRLAFPMMLRWEKGDFTLDWSARPLFTHQLMTENRDVSVKSEWSLQQVAVGCTFRIKSVKASFNPSLSSGKVNLSRAEIDWKLRNRERAENPETGDER